MWEDSQCGGCVALYMFSRNGSSLCVRLSERVSESFILSQSSSLIITSTAPLGCRNPPLWSGTGIIVLQHARFYNYMHLTNLMSA